MKVSIIPQSLFYYSYKTKHMKSYYSLRYPKLYQRSVKITQSHQSTAMLPTEYNSSNCRKN